MSNVATAEQKSPAKSKRGPTPPLFTRVRQHVCPINHGIKRPLWDAPRPPGPNTVKAGLIKRAARKQGFAPRPQTDPVTGKPKREWDGLLSLTNDALVAHFYTGREEVHFAANAKAEKTWLVLDDDVKGQGTQAEALRLTGDLARLLRGVGVESYAEPSSGDGAHQLVTVVNDLDMRTSDYAEYLREWWVRLAQAINRWRTAAGYRIKTVEAKALPMVVEYAPVKLLDRGGEVRLPVRIKHATHCRLPLRIEEADIDRMDAAPLRASQLPALVALFEEALTLPTVGVDAWPGERATMGQDEEGEGCRFRLSGSQVGLPLRRRDIEETLPFLRDMLAEVLDETSLRYVTAKGKRTSRHKATADELAVTLLAYARAKGWDEKTDDEECHRWGFRRMAAFWDRLHAEGVLERGFRVERYLACRDWLEQHGLIEFLDDTYTIPSAAGAGDGKVLRIKATDSARDMLDQLDEGETTEIDKITGRYEANEAATRVTPPHDYHKVDPSAPAHRRRDPDWVPTRGKPVFVIRRGPFEGPEWDDELHRIIKPAPRSLTLAV